MARLDLFCQWHLSKQPLYLTGGCVTGIRNLGLKFFQSGIKCYEVIGLSRCILTKSTFFSGSREFRIVLPVRAVRVSSMSLFPSLNGSFVLFLYAMISTPWFISILLLSKIKPNVSYMYYDWLREQTNAFRWIEGSSSMRVNCPLHQLPPIGFVDWHNNMTNRPSLLIPYNQQWLGPSIAL